MTDAVPVSALIVDDEPIARAGLRRMLGEVEWIRCSGEAASGPEALQSIAELQPELVFLDIEMPGLSGIDVLRALRQPPYVVFTTAYAEHAVDALMDRGFVQRLPPLPWSRAERYVQLLSPDLHPLEPPAGAYVVKPRPVEPSAPGLAERVAALEAEVTRLREQLQALASRLA